MTTHPTPALISRYAVDAAAVDDATVWAVETHLETCARCREVLAGAVGPRTRDLIDRAAAGIAAGIDAGPGPVPRRRLRRTGVTARILPWVATAVGLVLVALAFELTFESLPSLVLLVAPVAPLLPVAAVWSRRTDPAWELMATVPRNGLWLLLRRTLVVLAVVVPVLAAAGWQTGHQPGLWLLPCLTFTAGSLALGAAMPVEHAAMTLAGVWAFGVVLPGLLAGEGVPEVLEGTGWQSWTAVTVIATGVVVGRALLHRNTGAGRI